MSKNPNDIMLERIDADIARLRNEEESRVYDAGPVRRGQPVDVHLERISYLLDRAIRIPGTNLRFGLDPILSLIVPVAGDLVTTLVSAYIVLVSVRYGLPKIVIAQMVFNIAVDYMAGSVPVIGDLFDFAWKSNDRNLKLLNRHATGQGSFWSDWAWLLILFAILGLFVVGFLLLVWFAIRQLGGLF